MRLIEYKKRGVYPVLNVKMKEIPVMQGYVAKKNGVETSMTERRNLATMGRGGMRD